MFQSLGKRAYNNTLWNNFTLDWKVIQSMIGRNIDKEKLIEIAKKCNGNDMRLNQCF